MPHNPVQVVLNTKDYMIIPDRPPGGGYKDFYDGEDFAFQEHKERLLKQVSTIANDFKASKLEKNIVKVKLQRNALAKSHRPTKALFKQELTPCVGAGKTGELFYEIDQNSLQELERNISEAEDKKKVKNDKKGNPKEIVSPRRSAVGAIEEILLIEPSDRQSFSVDKAIAWLKNPRTTGYYIVELFDIFRSDILSLHLDKQDKQLEDFIGEVSKYAKIEPFIRDNKRYGVFAVKVIDEEGNFNPSIKDHSKLLDYLSSNPLVKQILLSPLIELSNSTAMAQSIGKNFNMASPEPSKKYPILGIIDGGVSALFDEWKLGQNDIIAPESLNLDHGSFIAGLLVYGNALNGPKIASEVDGCHIYDIAMLPEDGEFANYYPHIGDFFLELEQAIQQAKISSGARIFNMSLNLQSPVEQSRYSDYAKWLDEIADRNDVIIVISAGNLKSSELRPTWPSSAADVLKMFAERTHKDEISQPSESVRSISVGALSPDNVVPHPHSTPAVYSRRGPGVIGSIKPDVAHYGGVPGSNGGIYSLDKDGNIASGCGTSYATPLVAKALATLDGRIEGQVSKETLTALLIHHCETPDPLKDKSLDKISRQFVGFGLPKKVDEIILTDDHSITLVFADTLMQGRNLDFQFTWPECLVNSAKAGSCFGEICMTLVYSPPTNPKFDSEFLRANINACLRQYDSKTDSFKGKLKNINSPVNKIKKGSSHPYEYEMVKNGIKWWPTKKYSWSSKKGVGNSSEWKLVVESETRAEAMYPAKGIPFAIALTISDPTKENKVFDSLRQGLMTKNVNLKDIRTATRIRQGV